MAGQALTVDRDRATRWDEFYAGQAGTMWSPAEQVVRFNARYLMERVDHSTWHKKRPVDRVLDVGCGNGRHVVFWAQQGLHVAGVDLSSEAIRMAGKWLSSEGLSAEVRTGDAAELPFGDAAFDVALSYGVLDHMESRQAHEAIREVKRVVRPSGLVYLTLRSSQDWEYGAGDLVERNCFILRQGHEKGLPQHFFERDEIVDLLSGFRVLDTELEHIYFGCDLARRWARWYVVAERAPA